MPIMSKVSHISYLLSADFATIFSKRYAAYLRRSLDGQNRLYDKNPENVKVYLDVSLRRFSTVFPAAGSSNSAIEMTCAELEQYSSNFVEWVDVCKAWRPEEQV